MDLKKVCAFLAAAFLVVDVFLLVLCIHSHNNLLYLSNDMVENAVTFIRSQNTSVEPAVIKRKIPDNAIYTFQTENATLAFGVASKLSDAFFSGVPVSFVETPDGVSYTIGKSAEAVASLRVYNDSFRFEYAKTGFRRDSLALSPDAFSGAAPTLTEEQKKAADTFLESLNSVKNARSAYTLCGVMNVDGGVYASFSQNVYADYPISDMFVNVYMSDSDGVAYACGNRIFAAFSRSYSGTLTDGINALASLDFAAVESILSERIVYVHRYTGSGTHYLIPVWKIAYLDRDNHAQTLYVDTVKK